MSFLGLQSRSRAWRSWSETYFVMVMLTIPRLVRLFPHTGLGAADMLLDLAALTGDAPAETLRNGVGVEQSPLRISALLDQRLTSRMVSTRPVSESTQIAMARSILRGGGTVEQPQKRSRSVAVNSIAFSTDISAWDLRSFQIWNDCIPA